MVKTILVTDAIEAGSRLVTALRESGIRVTEAFWRYYEDAAYWRLLIVTPQLGSIGPTALYRTLMRILNDPDAFWSQAVSVDQIVFIPPTNLIYEQITHGVGLSVATGNPRDIVFEDVYRYAR